LVEETLEERALGLAAEQTSGSRAPCARGSLGLHKPGC
jgi:hypothetical protein